MYALQRRGIKYIVNRCSQMLIICTQKKTHLKYWTRIGKYIANLNT